MSVTHLADAPVGTWRASNSIRPPILRAEASHRSRPTRPAGSSLKSREQAVPQASLTTDRHSIKLLFAKARDVTPRRRQSLPFVRGIRSLSEGRSTPSWGSAHHDTAVGQTSRSEGWTQSTGTPCLVSSLSARARHNFARSLSVSHSNLEPYPNKRQSLISIDN